MQMNTAARDVTVPGRGREPHPHGLRRAGIDRDDVRRQVHGGLRGGERHLD